MYSNVLFTNARMLPMLLIHNDYIAHMPRQRLIYQITGGMELCGFKLGAFLGTTSNPQDK